MQWFDDPVFWDEMAFMMFHDERWANTPAEVDGIVARLGLDAGARVLDLCCGPGRHSMELAKRGFRVTGVDKHEPYLAQARAKGADVEWVHADMREFRRDDAFDAAINYYTSFGYFEDPADDRRVAANLRASLRDGGKLLIETMSKEVLARKYQPRRWFRYDDGTIVLDEPTILDGWSRVRNTWTRIRDGRQESFTFYQRLYAGSELAALLRDAGFARVDLFGGIDGRPYDQDAARLVAVATA
jgi:SAM-dependent methyltransferase